MFQLLLFLHVTSALFLGSYLVLPWLMKQRYLRSGDEFKGFLQSVLKFTRSAHYALIGLLITGFLMIVLRSAFPSVLWITIAIGLLLGIGAMIGMIDKKFKQILKSDHPKQLMSDQARTLNLYSWMAFFFILASIVIMTNPRLLA
ncbi:hypothetical protein ABES80_09200 [Bacillus gobiensis]|uniref:hypothetical protein n=1 Tax=Bacillus gobiensis TaxID=1441095 RepID=UPI003D246FC0